MNAKLLLAIIGLIGLALGWYLNEIPTWVTLLAGSALVIWGLNLDWRRKERESNERSRTKERRRRRAEREAIATEKRKGIDRS
jgi:hypothetical protein